MEIQNRAEWNSIRGPATIGLIFAISCGGLSLGLVAFGVLNPLVNLPIITAGLLGPAAVFALGLQMRKVWAPKWLEILPGGFVGYLQAGPLHHYRIEIAWQDIGAFVKPVRVSKLLSFEFPHVKAIVRASFRWNAPLSTLPDQVFKARGVSGRIALTEENLDSIRSAAESWRKDHRSGVFGR